MKSWFAARWQAFLISFDADEASSLSTPLATVFASGVLALMFLVIGVVPPLAELSGASATATCVGLALLGGALTLLSYRQRCRGTLGALCTLLDNGCYSASLTLAALTTRGGFALGLAVVHALYVLAFPANFYGLSLPMAIVLCGPTLALLAWRMPEAPVALVLLATCILSLVLMSHTSKRRMLVAGARRLELALGATDQVLDIAMQRALSSTLLGLANFLHELRNTQTAIQLNLESIEGQKLEPAQQRESLQSALEATRNQQTLLSDTLEALRRQAQPRAGALLVVGEVLEQTLRGRPDGLIVDYRSQAPRFEVQGEPAHLATVVRNLLRNARQAGATRVAIETELDAHGSLSIAVTDDGPGITREQATQLFRPFVTDGKPTGTGLGLYLCRRYVQLMSGEIRVDPAPGGGARFLIRLPGNLA
jgi:signal transduction histidine kinase